VARLDAADLKLAAENAEKDFRRGRALHAKGSLSDEALDRLQFRRDDTRRAARFGPGWPRR
jgi:hypothetical protein